MIDLVANDIAAQNPGKPSIGRGTILTTAQTPGDDLSVGLVGWSTSDTDSVPPSNWQPRVAIEDGAVVMRLPSRGASCVVHIDHLGDVWVTGWEPQDTDVKTQVTP